MLKHSVVYCRVQCKKVTHYHLVGLVHIQFKARFIISIHKLAERQAVVV